MLDDKFDEWTKERDERLRSSFLQEKESFGPVNSRVRLDNSPYRRRNQSESPPLSSESVYDLQHDYSFDSSSSFILSNCPYSKRMDNNVFELKEISVMNESNSDESNADESASKQSPRQLPAKSYFYDQDDISVDELDEVFRPSNYYEKAGHIRNKTCHENLYEEIRF